MGTALTQIVQSVWDNLALGLRAGVLAGPAIVAIALLGARGLTAAGQSIFAAVLALIVCPILAGAIPATAPSPSLMQLALSGLLTALAIASALAAAHMAGLVALQTHAGSPRLGRFDAAHQPPPGLGPLVNLAALLGFLYLGGPASLTKTLHASTLWLGSGPSPEVIADWGVRAVTPLVGAVAVAVAVTAPLLAARLLIAIFEGLWLRVTHPAAGDSGLRGLRQLAHVVLIGLLLERMLEQLLQHLARSL